MLEEGACSERDDAGARSIFSIIKLWISCSVLWSNLFESMNRCCMSCPYGVFASTVEAHRRAREAKVILFTPLSKRVQPIAEYHGHFGMPNRLIGPKAWYTGSNHRSTIHRYPLAASTCVTRPAFIMKIASLSWVTVRLSPVTSLATDMDLLNCRPENPSPPLSTQPYCHIRVLKGLLYGATRVSVGLYISKSWP